MSGAAPQRWLGADEGLRSAVLQAPARAREQSPRPGSPAAPGGVTAPRLALGVHLPAAETQPAGGVWAGARKETEPHVLRRPWEGRAEAPRSQLCVWSPSHRPSETGALKRGKWFLPGGNPFQQLRSECPGPRAWLWVPALAPHLSLPGDPKAGAGWDLGTGEQPGCGASLSPPQPSLPRGIPALPPTTLTPGPERGWEPRQLRKVRRPGDQGSRGAPRKPRPCEEGDLAGEIPAGPESSGSR